LHPPRDREPYSLLWARRNRQRTCARSGHGRGSTPRARRGTEQQTCRCMLGPQCEDRGILCAQQSAAASMNPLMPPQRVQSAWSFSISLHVGVKALFNTSAANSNSSATADQRPRVSRTATFAGSGSPAANRRNDCQVARAAAIAMIRAAANSTPQARYSMIVFENANAFASTMVNCPSNRSRVMGLPWCTGTLTHQPRINGHS